MDNTWDGTRRHRYIAALKDDHVLLPGTPPPKREVDFLLSGEEDIENLSVEELGFQVMVAEMAAAEAAERREGAGPLGEHEHMTMECMAVSFVGASFLPRQIRMMVGSALAVGLGGHAEVRAHGADNCQPRRACHLGEAIAS